MKRSIILLFLGLFLLVGCQTIQGGDTYSRAQMGRAATVMKGQVVSLRSVKISGSQSGVGAGAGAVAGAAAGSAVGRDARVGIIGAVGGAVVGGVVGAAAEENLTRAGAVEFIVQQDNGQLIAVVQTNDENLQAGDRVLVLRSDRVRLIRDTTAQ